jgi:hypothetical protein
MEAEEYLFATDGIALKTSSKIWVNGLPECK